MHVYACEDVCNFIAMISCLHYLSNKYKRKLLSVTVQINMNATEIMNHSPDNVTVVIWVGCTFFSRCMWVAVNEKPLTT